MECWDLITQLNSHHGLPLDVSLLGLSMKRSDHSNLYPGPDMRFRGSKTFYVNLDKKIDNLSTCDLCIIAF